MDLTLIVLLSGAILLILVAKAFWVIWKEKDAQRGSEPGKGYHEIDASYMSGVGGGQVKTFKVPKDPQEYARRFVPHDKR